MVWRLSACDEDLRARAGRVRSDSRFVSLLRPRPKLQQAALSASIAIQAVRGPRWPACRNLEIPDHLRFHSGDGSTSNSVSREMVSGGQQMASLQTWKQSLAGSLWI